MDDIQKFVARHVVTTHHGDGMKYDFQPGNGYRYEIFVLPVSDFYMDRLGSVDNGVLIVCGFTKQTYLFQSNTKLYLTAGYVGEKLFPEGYSRVIDINCITALIGAVLGRKTSIETLEQLGVKEE